MTNTETIALTPSERDRLVQLIDLLNDANVTQFDREEYIELNRLWAKLTDINNY